MHRDEFRAMGTTVTVLVEAEDADLSVARAEFERLEQIMSRFRPDSELSRLNADGSIDASQELAEVVGLAVEARARTGGRFDPTVHDALVAAGYDRTFDDVVPDGPVSQPVPCGGGVSVDGLRITLAPGVLIDLGGIGKGFAAERVAALLALQGPALVDAGGDIAVRGRPAGGTWPVAVDEHLTLGLDAGGIATSGVDRRRWLRGGEPRHHLIEPSTGLPSTTDLVRVTACAADAVQAEVLAKTLLLAGEREASATDTPAVLVTADGRRIRTGGL